LYDANAPEILPLSEVFSTILRVILFKWLPFGIRMIFVVICWLGLAPWSTSWLYRMWLLRASAMINVNLSERFDTPSVIQDIFSGIILIVCIIFSFLALMSFADFLRFHLDPAAEEAAAGVNNVNQPNAQHQDANNVPVGNNFQLRVAQEAAAAALEAPGRRAANPFAVDDDSDDSDDEWEHDEAERGRLFEQPIRRENVAFAADNIIPQEIPFDLNNLEPRNGLRRRRLEQNDAGLERPLPLAPENDQNQPVPLRPAVNVNANNNNNNNGEWDDDIEHMEINIAMDQLLGIRGPPYVLFRNVSWFLAFNGAYLGLFAFIPYTLGSTILSAGIKILTVVPFGSIFGWQDTIVNDIAESANVTTSVDMNLPLWTFFIKSLLKSIDEAKRSGDCLQLVDLATCWVGYLSICFTIILWRLMVTTASSYIHRRPLIDGLLWALRCLNAIVKVSTLLTLKMVVLPIVLGIGLDFATLDLFQVSPQERIGFIMENMIGSLLIHWVLGITFMLFVTISVLQLREVVHPEILANVIRPQESHPELLRTLLSERSIKHARRMGLSLLIYAGLLLILIYLPILATSSIMPNFFPLKFRFQHYAPQIQVPLELLLVHLVVLGVLEHAKNMIGRWQHIGMVFVCEKLNLTEFLLPRIKATWKNPENASAAPEMILAPPPLHFQPQAVLPPTELRVEGRRYLPWPEEATPPSPTPIALEYSLLPRKTPPAVIPRLFALILCAWVALSIIIAVGALGPLFLGRVCMRPFERMTGILHEPLVMAAGAQIGWYIVNAINAFLVATMSKEKVDSKLLRRGYCIRNMNNLDFVLTIVAWVFICPTLVGYLISSCFPHPDTSTFESFLMGYLGFNLFAWLVCCFRSKKNRRRRNNRRRGNAGQENVEDVEDEFDEEEEEEEDNNVEEELDADVIANPHNPDGFFGAFRLCFRQIMFNIKIHNDPAARLREDSMEEKCFDLAFFRRRVLLPILCVLLGCIIVPTIVSIGMTSVLSFKTEFFEKYAFVLSFVSMCFLVMLVRGHTHVGKWVSNVRESIRNERYLIGRQLMDMAR
jgi:E3 ubiquitin-protein ligase MARCH6